MMETTLRRHAMSSLHSSVAGNYNNSNVRMAEWSKAPDSSSGLRERAWLCDSVFYIWALENNPKGQSAVPGPETN
ncbi:hypothetical protein JHK85_049397 [Glycine max]|nr:hypothetical protein JHK85_049397 [Glycine max]